MTQSRRGLVLQSMLLAVGLGTLKVAAGILSGSVSVMASALDSAMDLLSTSIDYFSLWLSERPPDDEHPYGHGKVESMAGAGQGIVITVSGAAILVEAIRRVRSGVQLEIGTFTIGVMVLAAVLSAAHGWRLSRAAGRTGSCVLRAEGLNFTMDVLANVGVLTALVIVRFGGSCYWDVALSVLISGYVVWRALALLGTSLQELMDQRLSRELHAELGRIIRGHHPSIKGFHALRTRKAGPVVFIDVHVEMKGIEKFEAAHDITEDLIERIKKAVPGADVTIHHEPAGGR